MFAFPLSDTSMKIINFDSLWLLFEEKIQYAEISFQTLDKEAHAVTAILGTKLGKKILKQEFTNNNDVIPQYIIEQVRLKFSDVEERDIHSILEHYVTHHSPFSTLILIIFVFAIASIFAGIMKYSDPFVYSIFGLIVVIAKILLNSPKKTPKKESHRIDNGHFIDQDDDSLENFPLKSR